MVKWHEASDKTTKVVLKATSKSNPVDPDSGRSACKAYPDSSSKNEKKHVPRWTRIPKSIPALG
jgi:hypothetical protein